MAILSSSEVPITFSYSTVEVKTESAKTLRDEARDLRKQARKKEKRAANIKATEKARKAAERKRDRRRKVALDRLEKVVRDGSDEDAIEAASELLNRV